MVSLMRDRSYGPVDDLTAKCQRCIAPFGRRGTPSVLTGLGGSDNHGPEGSSRKGPSF